MLKFFQKRKEKKLDLERLKVISEYKQVSHRDNKYYTNVFSDTDGYDIWSEVHLYDLNGDRVDFYFYKYEEMTEIEMVTDCIIRYESKIKHGVKIKEGRKEYEKWDGIIK